MAHKQEALDVSEPHLDGKHGTDPRDRPGCACNM